MATKRVTGGDMPWERLPGESVRNYEYFCAYRDMRYTPAANADDIPKLDLKRERSLRNLAEKLEVNKRNLGILSSRFNWVARCDAYDMYILRRQRDRNEAQILKMRENHAAVGEQLWKRALRRILSISDEEIEAGDMVRMIDIGTKIERLSRGELSGGHGGFSRQENMTVSDTVREEVEAVIRNAQITGSGSNGADSGNPVSNEPSG